MSNHSYYLIIYQILVFYGFLLNQAFGTEFPILNKRELDIQSNKCIIDKDRNVIVFDGAIELWLDDILLITSNIQIFFHNVKNRIIIDQILIPKKLKLKKNNQIILANFAKYDASKQIIELHMAYLESDQKILVAKKLKYKSDLLKIRLN